MAEIAANQFDNNLSGQNVGGYVDDLKKQVEQAAKIEVKKRKHQASQKIRKALIHEVSERFGVKDFEKELDRYGDDSTKGVAQAGSRIAFRQARKRAIKAAAKKGAQKAAAKAAQKIASKALVRVIALACGATVVGLIVTYLIWTAQAIAGNWLGSKWIPKLDSFGDGGLWWWEFPAWLFLSIIIAILLVVVLFVAVAGAAFSNPLILVGIAWQIITN